VQTAANGRFPLLTPDAAIGAKVRIGLILLKNSKILQSYFFAIEVKYRKPLPKLLPLTHRSIRLAMIEN